MSVRIRRIDDHSDEGYIRVVLDTPAKAKAEIIYSYLIAKQKEQA